MKPLFVLVGIVVVVALLVAVVKGRHGPRGGEGESPPEEPLGDGRG